MLDFLRHVFGWVCGQNPAHTWSPGGERLPVCQRCTGVYAGAFLAALLHLWWRIAPTPAGFRRNGAKTNRGQECPRSGTPGPRWLWLWLNGGFLLFIVPNGFYWIPQNPELRCASGILFGFGLVAFLWLTLPARFVIYDLRFTSGSAIVDQRVNRKSQIAYLAVLLAALGLVPLLAEHGNAAGGVILSAACAGGALALAALLLANLWLLLRGLIRWLARAPA